MIKAIEIQRREFTEAGFALHGELIATQLKRRGLLLKIIGLIEIITTEESTLSFGAALEPCSTAPPRAAADSTVLLITDTAQIQTARLSRGTAGGIITAIVIALAGAGGRQTEATQGLLLLILESVKSAIESRSTVSLLSAETTTPAPNTAPRGAVIRSYTSHPRL